MAQAPQEISIVYGSFTIDDTNKANYLILDNTWNVQYTDVAATVNYKVLIKGSTETEYFVKVNLFLDAYRDTRKTLTILLSGATYYSWTTGTPHSDSIPKITGPLEDEHFTNVTGVYTVSIDVAMKALTARRSETVQIVKDASNIRTMTITATYNATDSIGAYQGYQADFDSFCTSVKTFINAREGSATWEQVQDPNLNTNTFVNNVVNITRIFKELIFKQSEGILDDPELTDFGFTIDFAQSLPGDTLPSQAETFVLKRIPKRLVDCAVSVRANVPKTTTDLESVYNSKIHPYIINHARERGGFALLGTTAPKVGYDRVNNVITSSFQIQGATEGAGQVVSSSVTIHEMNVYPKLIVGAHDGTPFGRYVVIVKAKRTRTITENLVFIDFGKAGGSGGSSGGGGGNVGIGVMGRLEFNGGSPFGQGGIGIYNAGSQPQLSFSSPASGTSDGGGGGSIGDGGGGNGRYEALSTDDSTTPKVIGLVEISGESFPVVEKTFVTVQEYLTDPVEGGTPQQSVTTTG